MKARKLRLYIFDIQPVEPVQVGKIVVGQLRHYDR